MEQTLAQKFPRADGGNGFFRLIIQAGIAAGVHKGKDTVELMLRKNFICKERVLSAYVKENQCDNRHRNH